jgi:quercetin 2,3-dioxygenase
MITLRRAEERLHERRRRLEIWLTFFAEERAATSAPGFGSLEVLSEGRLSPGGAVPRRPHRDAEVITYVREGALTYEDSSGRTGIIDAGEFQRMTTGSGVYHVKTNASRSDEAHVFQIWLCPVEVGRETRHEQRRFSAAQRRGGLCVVVSPDSRAGSLGIHQDARIYSALLDPGQHVVHELVEGRSAWLHVVSGEVALGDVVLTTGDGAGVRGERALSMTARRHTEILLLDLGAGPPASRRAVPLRG